MRLGYLMLLLLAAMLLVCAGCSARDPQVLATELGCEGATLLQRTVDPAARGPWPVGARSVEIAGLPARVWYPARPGSEGGRSLARYDLRLQLPPAEQGKIPDSENPFQECECYFDLPLDEERGPYPVVLFLHGLGGFGTQSARHTTHWASRGFVVVAADHPGAKLGDVLVGRFGSDQPGDAGKILAAVTVADGALGFLKGRIDLGRVAIAGHSLGGGALAGIGALPGVQVLIPMAAGGVEQSAAGKSILIVGALDDGIVPWSRQEDGFGSSPRPKRLVGIGNAGHLAFSDLCFIGRDRGGILQVAQDNGVTVSPLFTDLATDGCRDGQLPAEAGWDIIHHVTSAALEETLHCSDTAAGELAATPLRYPAVAVFREDL